MRRVLLLLLLLLLWFLMVSFVTSRRHWPNEL
jgi:hypothetical protein